MIEKRKVQIDEIANVIGISFMILTVALFTSIALLVWRLQVKLKELKQRGEESNDFGKEIWNVIVIMMVFSSSFLLRIVYTLFIVKIFIDPKSGTQV